MASQHEEGIRTFPAAAGSGITARRGVVQDAVNRGDVKLPAATPELTFVGFAIEDISAANNVAVQTYGYAVAMSDGSAVINPGDDLILVGTSGYVKSKALAAGSANLYQIVGTSVSDQVIPAVAGVYVTINVVPYKICAA